ncbi:uncharacterized protein LOC132728331 [Ruditapes philippinarum]|uniref:uncharacterized protein LOC132728331 n=1 Tax=Ruditapes philippinarum TaxID=129788 RepID=UPI00295BEAC8|nr:uncharacterized protein LOC132728331 [Ruditapes philippinarum]
MKYYSEIIYLFLAIICLVKIGDVLCYRCHVNNDVTDLDCGNAFNMSCKGVAHIPHCTQFTTDPAVQMNGVCSCEKFCFTDLECAQGCKAPYVGKCLEGYHLSIEKICLCEIST